MEERAIFAGGCFWCMQPPYDSLKDQGVISVTVGYAGGDVPSPTYEQVSTGRTGHAEVIEIVFDPEKISYEKLLEIFWENIDPTVQNKQFCDVGTQYRSAIFYTTEHQKELALSSKAKQEKKFGKVYTDVVPFKNFYPAEKYHQDYYLKNSYRYNLYKEASGREGRLKELWKE